MTDSAPKDSQITVTQTQVPLLERVISSLQEFPLARAAVIPVVMKLTSDPNSTPDDLARILSRDPILSAMVLRLSNSSFYGRVRAVGSLKEAVMVLGVSLLRSLAVASSVSSLFRVREDKLEQVLWDHSLATAIGARVIARRTGSSWEEEAFLAGLVHDVAQLILLQILTSEYKQVLSEMTASGGVQPALEEKRLGFTHEELGARILEQWNFPATLVEVVRRHHTPDDPECEGEDTLVGEGVRELRHIVCLADTMAESLGHGFPRQIEWDLSSHASTVFFSLSPEMIAEISDEIATRFAEEQELFQE